VMSSPHNRYISSRSALTVETTYTADAKFLPIHCRDYVPASTSLVIFERTQSFHAWLGDGELAVQSVAYKSASHEPKPNERSQK
jgi:hypothetical protein